MKTKTRKISYADLIWLYQKHSALWSTRRFFYTADKEVGKTVKEKDFLEFLLGTEIPYNSFEFEAAVTICLNELADQLPDFATEVLPKLRELQQKVAKLDADEENNPRGLGFFETNHARLIREELTALAEQFKDSQVSIKPFKSETQLFLRKKIILWSISWSGIIPYINSPEVQRLITLNCQETGVNLQKRRSEFNL